jgi:hypothetical protein
MLAAKIALAKGDKKSAYELFTKAVRLKKCWLTTNRPTGTACSEVFGGALLLNGDNAQAETVFRRELERHP